MTISAIICTRNRSEWLEWSIGALALQELRPTETILVDGSDDEHAERNRQALREHEDRLGTVSYLRTTPGITLQRNIGANAATGDVVVFIDDDALIHPSYLQRVIERFVDDPSVIGVGGVIWNEMRRSAPATAFRRFFTMTDNLRPRLTRSGDAGHLYECRGVVNVEALSGSNMAFRRSVFAEDGLQFDENLKGYGFGEDQLFCLQAGAKGRLQQTEDALVMHAFRRNDRLSAKYARDQVTHAAYIFATAGRKRGGRLGALLWRLFGRTIYEVGNGLLHKRWDAAGGAIGGLRHVLMNLGALKASPTRLLEDADLHPVPPSPVLTPEEAPERLDTAR
jgi:GT2 family glycosyltransferase